MNPFFYCYLKKSILFSIQHEYFCGIFLSKSTQNGTSSKGYSVKQTDKTLHSCFLFTYICFYLRNHQPTLRSLRIQPTTTILNASSPLSVEIKPKRPEILLQPSPPPVKKTPSPTTYPSVVASSLINSPILRKKYAPSPAVVLKTDLPITKKSVLKQKELPDEEDYGPVSTSLVLSSASDVEEESTLRVNSRKRSLESELDLILMVIQEECFSYK
jgi:hypothetical protein